MKSNREYAISRYIICILVFVSTFLVMINEDISMKLVGTVGFTIAALLAGIVGTFISKRMIRVGDCIEKRELKVLYYLVLLLASLAVMMLLWLLSYIIYSVIPQSSDLSTALGNALVFVFCCLCISIFVVAPYIQTIIVLCIRK